MILLSVVLVFLIVLACLLALRSLLRENPKGRLTEWDDDQQARALREAQQARVLRENEAWFQREMGGRG